MAINLVPFLASNTQNIATCMRDQKVPSPGRTWQWRIQGRPPPPLIFRRNWGPKGRKYFFSNHPPPSLISGLDDRAPLIWRSGSAAALNRLYQLLKGKTIIIMHACLSLPGKRTYAMLAWVQQSYETRSYDFKIKYWDDFDTRLEWLKNSSKHSNVSQQDWSANLPLEF